LAVVAFTMSAGEAQAMPSYARQTGEPCTSCHVGAYGPQLTPHGRAFKIGGYSDAKDEKFRPPVSAMLVANYTHTKKDQSTPISGHDGTNNNLALQEASIFIAGKLAPHLGAFIQTTYSEIDRATAFDHADVRYARTLQLGGKDLVLGLDLNNNPTVQDPFNTVGAWSFPYTASDLVPGHATGAFLTGGLEHQVLGSSVYAYFNDHLYAEAGAYRSLSHGLLGTLGIGDEAGKLKGAAPYWRVAYNREWNKQSASIGLIGMNAGIHPERNPGPTNKYRDVGLDLSYQYLGNRKNVFSANLSHIWERQKLDYDVFAGETGLRKQKLRQMNADVSWYHNNAYGLTAGLFKNTGTRDTALFVPEEDVGSRTGSPNTSGYILQADWTPLGKESSPLAPNVNLRLGVQYTGYSKFNGSKLDYDGFGRNASANNTLMLFTWLSF
jgi:hypothetical protein